MSTTEIYRLGRKPQQIGECSNGFRSAMYVWNYMAQRYWGLDTFPFTGDMQTKVWNTPNHHKVPDNERIVLLSTMDNAVARFDTLEHITGAFQEFGKAHPHSSFLEQGEIIKNADLKKGDFVAWQQTSVGEFWGMDWNEKTDRPVWYNPKKGDRHFDIIGELNAPTD